MGTGAFLVRAVGLVAVGGLAYVGVFNPIISRIRQDSAVVEPGYVSPKSLSVQGKKNAQGNVETYLIYKSGEETVSLPCKKGPEGPLCGLVEYWWSSIGAQQREGLVVGEFPSISIDAQSELSSNFVQEAIDFYRRMNGGQGGQKALQPKPQPQYDAGKQK